MIKDELSIRTLKIPFLSNMDKLTVANSMAIFTFVPPCTKEQGCLSTLEAVAEAGNRCGTTRVE